MEMKFKWRQLYERNFGMLAAVGGHAARHEVDLVEQRRLRVFGVAKVTQADSHQTEALSGFQSYTPSEEECDSGELLAGVGRDGRGVAAGENVEVACL